MAIIQKIIVDNGDIPQIEDWDVEIKENPWPSGSFKLINGELIYI
jgi:hypothetical protein